MSTETIQSLQGVAASANVEKQAQAFPSLDQESRSHVETACAAFHLIRKGQTLRSWACLENGPIRPIRVNGRLAWPVADIKVVLAGGAR